MRDPFSYKHGTDREVSTPTGTSRLDFEEAVLDDQTESGLNRLGAFRVPWKIFLPIFFAAFAAILGRLGYLTIYQHDYYQRIAQGNRLRAEYVSAPRGAIYDSQGSVIVANQPSFELDMYPADLPKDPGELERTIASLAQTLGIAPEEIKAAVNNRQTEITQSILVKQSLTRDQALIFQERADQFPGFQVANMPIRDYKFPEDFAHLIGYTGKINADEYKANQNAGYLFNDSLGKTGLEQEYEKYLRGTFGQRQVEVDSRGNVKTVFGEKPAIPGDNLFLNIDAGLQKKLYDSLRGELAAINKKKGAAIAMDPQTGKILAMVSLPSFDNNLFAQGISSEEYQKLNTDPNLPLFNRDISGTYPPGSTVKPMVATAALQEKVITPNTIVNDQGYILVKNVYGGPDYYFYGYRRTGLGRVDVRQAIALSSDIFFYTVGGGNDVTNFKGLGITKLAEYYRRYHIGELLGIDLPGEAVGLVPTPQWRKALYPDDPVAAKWYLGDTYHVSIGQGDLSVTPLNMVSWISTIANGGTIYRPYIVDRITDNAGAVVQKYNPQSLGSVGIDAANLQIVREGMRQTVTGGTARSLNALPITVAGKTGTAQFDAKNLARTHAWFAAYAPYENPQIAIVVLIEDGGEGSSVSVPVAREALQWWADNRYKK